MYPPFIYADLSPDLLDDLPQVFDLTRTRPDFTIEPPAPAVSDSKPGVTGNKRIHDDEPFPIGNGAEIRDASDIDIVLTAAMQHHEQRQGSAVPVTAGQVQLESPGSRSWIRAPVKNPFRIRPGPGRFLA